MWNFNNYPSPREHSPDGQTGTQMLLQSQKKIYRSLEQRFEDPNNSEEKRTLILHQMQEVAKTIADLEGRGQNNQNADPTIETLSHETMPFNVLSGYCDIDVIGGFADGRYSVIDVRPAGNQSTQDYNDEKFLSQGFQRYDLRLKMDRKNNYFTTKPIFIRYEPQTARLYIGFEGQVYPVVIPRNSSTREGMIVTRPGSSSYRESTTTAMPVAVDIGPSRARLHLVIDVGGLR